jgi:uncharacterized membrane protein
MMRGTLPFINPKSALRNPEMPEVISEYIPQLARDEEWSRRVRRAWLGWALALSAAALLVGAIVAAPLLRARGLPLASLVLYQGFHVVCHQMPERSFHLWGFPLAVCARCFGLYVGALAGIAVYPLARGVWRKDLPARTWLILGALPTTVDFALGFFGLWENTHWSRFSTALLAGAVTAFYLVPGVVDLCLAGFGRPKGVPRSHTDVVNLKL